MPMTDENSPPAPPSTPRRRWTKWAVTGLFLMTVAFWATLTTHLMQASKKDVSDLKVRLMNNPVAYKLMPPSVRRVLRDPSQFDRIGHFVFYLPFGFAVGLGAHMARWWFGRHAWKKAFLGLLAAVLLWAAFDEWAQRFADQRSSNLADLTVTYLGVAAGLLLYFVAWAALVGVRAAWRGLRRQVPREAPAA